MHLPSPVSVARCMLTVLGGVGEDMFFLPMQEHNYFIRSLVVCNNLNGDYKKLIIPMNCIIYDWGAEETDIKCIE